jgi:spore coat protein U domain-containing protein, fimbrial subunit CupE1/2/3/6
VLAAMKPTLTEHKLLIIRSRCAASRCVGALVGLLLFAIAAPAAAGVVSCGVSATGVSFGNYDVFAASSITSTTTISVTCTLTSGGTTTVSYAIALSPGLSSTFVQRQMKNGANALGYNLYSDSARTTVWGDGTGGAPTVSGSMRVKPSTPTLTNNVTAYGSVPALQDVAVGAYSDGITITVSY